HRFSPYFEKPSDFGLTDIRPHHLYKFIIPVDDMVLNDLVYMHEFSVASTIAAHDYVRMIQRVCAQWREARVRGAKLRADEQEDGSVVITDTRRSEPQYHVLEPKEAVVYRRLDAAISETALATLMHAEHANEAADIGRDGGVKC